jgi:hypothetical protein
MSNQRMSAGWLQANVGIPSTADTINRSAVVSVEVAVL